MVETIPRLLGLARFPASLIVRVRFALARQLIGEIVSRLPVPYYLWRLQAFFPSIKLTAYGILKASKLDLEPIMKLQRFFSVFGLLAALGLGVMPAWGVNKEIIELQTQVQQLQQQMTLMQRSFDERIGCNEKPRRTDTDAVNKVATAINSMQGIIQKQQGRFRASRPTLRPSPGT